MSDFKKLIYASDLIEWIMETYPDWCVGDVRSIVDHVEDMPSAQPEIIRCGECKHWREDHTCGEHSLVSPMMAYEFCSRAERRQDEHIN